MDHERPDPPGTPTPNPTSVHQVSIRLGRGTLALLAILMLGSALLGGFIVSRFSPSGTTTVAAAPPTIAIAPPSTTAAPLSPVTSTPADRRAGADPAQTPPTEAPPPTTEPGPGDVGAVEPDGGDTLVGGYGEDPAITATYPVRGQVLGGDPTPRHTAAWNRITELVPDRYLNLLSALEVLDGDGESAAYVYPDDADPTRWVLGIDISGMGDTEEFTHTIVHELGHLVSLNSDQVPPVPTNSRYDAVAEACRTYFTGEGCALDGSYMGRFAGMFWNDILDEWQALDEIADEDAYWEALDRFWSRHSDRFVSDYAATNPGEDMAETFAWFVLHDRPTGDSIAERKVLFMWDQPELVSLREEIRAGV